MPDSSAKKTKTRLEEREQQVCENKCENESDIKKERDSDWGGMMGRQMRLTNSMCFSENNLHITELK